MTKTSIFCAAVGVLSCAMASCSGDEAGNPTPSFTGGGGSGASTVSDGTSSTSTVDGGSTTAGTTTTASATTSNASTSGGDVTNSDTTTSTSSSDGTADTSGGTTGGVVNTTGDTTSTTGDTTSTTGDTTSTSTNGGGGAGGTSTVDTTTSTTGTVDDGDCMTPPAAPALEGWASEAGGTVGGGDATPTVVSSTGEFNSAIAGSGAQVIHVNGSLSGDFNLGSNKTIIGVCGAEIHGSIRISGQQNIIMRNLRVVGYDCDDSPGQCSAGADAIGVRSSHHIWFDHMEVSDGSDGNLDMTNNSDYITISWTKFFYSSARTDPVQGASGHRFSNLIAGSDSDSGDYRITFHHNWWAENVDQRMPRTRFGDIHVFNNLFTSSGNSYCTNSGFSTHLLVENNIYRGVNNPLSPDGNGDMRAEGNVFDGTSGNTSDNGGTGFNPPYNYTLDATDGLDTVLQAEVGPHD